MIKYSTHHSAQNKAAKLSQSRQRLINSYSCDNERRQSRRMTLKTLWTAIGNWKSRVRFPCAARTPTAWQLPKAAHTQREQCKMNKHTCKNENPWKSPLSARRRRKKRRRKSGKKGKEKRRQSEGYCGDEQCLSVYRT